MNESNDDLRQAGNEAARAALDLADQILGATDSGALAQVIAGKEAGLLAAAIMFALATAQYEGSLLGQGS